MLKAVTEWAFFKDDKIYFIVANVEQNNLASQKVLEKNKYTQVECSETDLLKYEIKKAPMQWMPVMMCFGLSFGLAIGNISDFGTGYGMSIGMCLGMLIGVAIDQSEKKKFQKIEDQRAEKGQDE